MLGTLRIREPGGPSAAPRPPRPQALSSRAPSWGLQPLRGPARPQRPRSRREAHPGQEDRGSFLNQGRSGGGGGEGVAESSGPLGPLGPVARSRRLAPSARRGRWWQTPSCLQKGSFFLLLSWPPAHPFWVFSASRK